MQTPATLSFTAHPYGFYARGPRHLACFLEAQCTDGAISWSWRIHSVDMQTLLAEGTCPTPDSAEAAMRAWLSHASVAA